MVDILKYEEIGGDLTDITRRLKEIDESYFVLRERKSGYLSLHSSAQKGGTLALSLPYKQLDCRTLELARRTRHERAAQLMKEMEERNDYLERAAAYERAKQAERKTEQLLKEGDMKKCL